MDVVAWSPNLTDERAAAAGVQRVDKATLFRCSDVVSLHLLLNDETTGFVSRAHFARMKPGAILVNTARGAVIDEGALIDALKSGQIGHAALDVFVDEPLPANTPFATLDNVTLSAHSAFMTPEASETLLRRALDIAVRVVGG